jgi:hypothetical protein
MRFQHWMWRHASWAVFLALLLLTRAQAGGPDKSDDKASDEKARAHLKKMSDFLAGLKGFSIIVDEALDTVDDDGLRIQSNRRRRVWVNHPDQFRSDTTGDTADLLFVFSKGRLLLVDKENASYVAEKAPATIDGVLQEVGRKYGLSAALSDFAKADPYKGLTGHVREARYVGQSQIGDRKVHHLAFRQKLIDWQLWIEDGETPLPRKFVITYKRQPGEPQYQAALHHWDLKTEHDAKLFDLSPPEGAKRIEVASPAADKKP